MPLRSLLLIVIVLAAVPASAQQDRAVIRGEVLDPSGRPMPGVEIQVTRESTGETRRTQSDAAGRYSVPQLLPGTYRVRAEHPGFGTFLARTSLTVHQDAWLPVNLPLGDVVQAVDVQAQVIPIQREAGALSTLIHNELVANLPLDGRNFLELALLAPGTAPAAQGSASSVRGDFSFNVNGAREDFNNYLLDGVYNVDPKLGTVGVRPPVDAIREFEVLTSTYDASFGRNGGGVVNVVTRSGTNAVQGTAYEFFRGKTFASRNYFAPKDERAPDYSRHQFGGSVGGPLVRDRTFFFGDYEHTRLREGITRIASVPTLAERTGDFSATARAPRNPFTGAPFANNRIPAAFLNPVGAAIAALYPEPNRNTPGANFVSSPTLRDNVNQFDARLDHNLAQGTTMTARYSFSDRDLLEPFAGPAFATIPGFGTEVARRGQNAALAFTHAQSPAFANDLRLGYQRVSIGVFAENTGVDNMSVGLPSFGTAARDAGLSAISIAGYSPLGHDYTTPQESTTDSFQLSDIATWMRGAHLIKFGGELTAVRQSAYRDVQSRGFLTFVDQGYTGSALADLLLGLPVLTGGARLDNPQRLRTRGWGLFVQDDWRPSSSLTLSAGLRYDYGSPPVDADDRANLYDLTEGRLVPLGTSGMPRGGYDADRNNLAPRLGFSWALNEAATALVRGGYGIYYNQGALATSEGLYFNPPFFDLGVFFPAPGLPPLTLFDPFPATFPIAIPQSATAYQRDLETPWMQHWNVSIQRQVGRARAIELSYVGSRGHDLISARDVNQPPASADPLNLRPDPLFADITLIESRGSSRYNALQLEYQQRTNGGLSMLGSYTLGKSTDDASGFFTSAGDPNFPQNSLDPERERGRSSFDLRHRLSVSLSYPLPFGPEGRWMTEGWKAAVFGELELVGVLTLQSGRPFTVTLHPDVDNSNTGRSNLGFGYNDRPNVTGDPESSRPREEQWFDTSAFSLPPFGSFGNAGRNIIGGPDYRNANVALIKAVQAGRDVRLQLRLEAFNLFNRANFDLPDAVFGSPTFGRILSAGPPRRWQLGVRALF